MFDNIKPIDPRWEKRKKLIWIALGVFIVIAPIFYYEFKNWPEEHAAKTFLTALSEERYPDAYHIWNPGPSYTQDDFLADWGKKSQYGKINSFHIKKSHELGSGVVITVAINGAHEA